MVSFLYDNIEDDESLECEQCHEYIGVGEKYFEYKGHTFCSRDCAGIWWSHQTDEIDEIHILTRYEKSMIMADFINDQRRDEGWTE